MIFNNVPSSSLLLGPTWRHKEGELSPAQSPAGGRDQQLCETLPLQQHERQQDGQLHPGPCGHNGP